MAGEEDQLEQLTRTTASPAGEDGTSAEGFVVKQVTAVESSTLSDENDIADKVPSMVIIDQSEPAEPPKAKGNPAYVWKPVRARVSFFEKCNVADEKNEPLCCVANVPTDNSEATSSITEAMTDNIEVTSSITESETYTAARVQSEGSCTEISEEKIVDSCARKVLTDVCSDDIDTLLVLRKIESSWDILKLKQESKTQVNSRSQTSVTEALNDDLVVSSAVSETVIDNPAPIQTIGGEFRTENFIRIVDEDKVVDSCSVQVLTNVCSDDIDTLLVLRKIESWDVLKINQEPEVQVISPPQPDFVSSDHAYDVDCHGGLTDSRVQRIVGKLETLADQFQCSEKLPVQLESKCSTLNIRVNESIGSIEQLAIVEPTSIEQLAEVEATPSIELLVMVEVTPSIGQLTMDEPILFEQLLVDESFPIELIAEAEATPSIEQLTVVETTPSIEQLTVVEATPSIGQLTTDEPIPIDQVLAAAEPFPIQLLAEVEARPSIEQLAVVETTPSIEQLAVVEATLSIGQLTMGEPFPIELLSAAVEATSSIEQLAVVETTPSIEQLTGTEEARSIKNFAQVEEKPSIEEFAAVEATHYFEQRQVLEATPSINQIPGYEEIPSLEQLPALAAAPLFPPTRTIISFSQYAGDKITPKARNLALLCYNIEERGYPVTMTSPIDISFQPLKIATQQEHFVETKLDLHQILYGAGSHLVCCSCFSFSAFRSVPGYYLYPHWSADLIKRYDDVLFMRVDADANIVDYDFQWQQNGDHRFIYPTNLFIRNGRVFHAIIDVCDQYYMGLYDDERDWFTKLISCYRDACRGIINMVQVDVPVVTVLQEDYLPTNLTPLAKQKLDMIQNSIQLLKTGRVGGITTLKNSVYFMENDTELSKLIEKASAESKLLVCYHSVDGDSAKLEEFVPFRNILEELACENADVSFLYSFRNPAEFECDEIYIYENERVAHHQELWVPVQCFPFKDEFQNLIQEIKMKEQEEITISDFEALQWFER